MGGPCPRWWLGHFEPAESKGETAGFSPLAFIMFVYVLSACVAGLLLPYLFVFVFLVAALCKAGGKPSAGTFI